MEVVTRESLGQIIRTEAQDYTLEESAIIRRGKQQLSQERYILEADKVVIKEDTGVVVKVSHVDGVGAVKGSGAISVDASVAACLAHVFVKDDLESTVAAAEREGEGVPTVVKKLNNHSHLYFSGSDPDNRGFSSCAIFAKGVWQVDRGGTAFLVYEDASPKDLVKDFPMEAGSSKTASVHLAFMFEPLGSVTSRLIPQTKVTAVASFDFRQQLSSAAVNFMAAQVCKHLSDLRIKFDRSIEIDDVRRSDITERIKLAKRFTGGDFASRFEDKDGKVSLTTIMQRRSVDGHNNPNTISAF